METGVYKSDSVWKIVVGISAFIAQGLLGGYVYTAGIFYTIFKDEFPDVSEVEVSWMCNLPLTLWFLSGPFGSILTNKFGCRACAVIGGCASCLGLVLCFLSSSFYMVFAFYGVTAGIGNGLHHIAFITFLNKTFKTHRLIATLLATTGLTTGMAIYAIIIPNLTELYGWRGTLLTLGGLTMNLIPLGLTLASTEEPSSSKRGLNFNLLKHNHFMLFAVQCILCNLSSSVMFLHLPALILSFDLSMSVTSISLTLYGIANCLTKLFHSGLGYFIKPDALLVYTCSLIICGGTMVIFPIINNKIWIIFLSAILGSTYCVTGGYTPEVIINLVGVDCISDGLGFGQIAKAFGSLIAGPFAGLLFQWSGRYQTSFYVSGSFMIVGCMILLPVVRTLRMRRNTQAVVELNLLRQPTSTDAKVDHSSV